MHIKITRSIIPNLFTVMNAFCGFLSIVNTSEGNYTYASVLIIISALFDMFDGLAARITKSASEFGVELDSLSDLISFGAAPAFLIYKIQLFELQELGLLISAFFMICGALRLARFNVQLVGFDKKYFYGIPIPTAALTISSFVITFYHKSEKFPVGFDQFFFYLVIVLSLLMVSKIKYPTLPKPTAKEIKQKPIFFLFIFVSLVLTVSTNGKAIFYLISIFIVYGIIRALTEFIYYTCIKKSEENT